MGELCVDHVRRRRVNDDKEESSVPEKNYLLNCLRRNLSMCVREDLQPYDVQTQPSDEAQGLPCEPHEPPFHDRTPPFHVRTSPSGYTRTQPSGDACATPSDGEPAPPSGGGDRAQPSGDACACAPPSDDSRAPLREDARGVPSDEIHLMCGVGNSPHIFADQIEPGNHRRDWICEHCVMCEVHNLSVVYRNITSVRMHSLTKRLLSNNDRH